MDSHTQYEVVAVYTQRVNQNISDLVLLIDEEEYTVPILRAIRLINGGNGLYTLCGGERIELQIVNGPIRGTYLRTKPDGRLEGNLLHLVRHR